MASIHPPRRLGNCASTKLRVPGGHRWRLRRFPFSRLGRIEKNNLTNRHQGHGAMTSIKTRPREPPAFHLGWAESTFHIFLVLGSYHHSGPNNHNDRGLYADWESIPSRLGNLWYV